MKVCYYLSAVIALLATCTAVPAQDLKAVKDKSTKLFGYQDKSKNWVIEPRFDKARAFNMGTAIVTVGGLEGLIDTEGNFLVEPLLSDIANFDKDGLSRVMVKEDRQKIYGVINLAGDFVIPVDCIDVYIENRRQLIHAEKYYDVDSNYSPDRVYAWGLYDYQGEEIFPPMFQYRLSFDGNGISTATDKASGLKGVVGINGEVLIDIDKYDIRQSDGRYLVLGDDFHWRIFAPDLVQVGDEYSALADWGNGLRSPDGYYKALKGGSWGIIDADGRVVRPFAFSNPIEAEGMDVGHFDEREMASAQARAAARPWAVAAYDTQGDDARAAAYGHLMIGTRLYRNMISRVKYSGSPSNRFDVTLSSLADTLGRPVNWGNGATRFVLLEPVADDEGELVYSRSGQAYTFTLTLYNQDGSPATVLSRFGRIIGTTGEGILYESQTGEQIFISYDVNLPGELTSLALTNYRQLPDGSLEAALLLTPSEERTLDNYWSAKKLHTDVGVLQKTGWQSYEARPILNSHQRDLVERVGARYSFLRRKFRQNQVFTFTSTPRFNPDSPSVSLQVTTTAMAHYQDDYSPSSYRMVLDEPVFWGVNGDRYIKVELVPFPLSAEELASPELMAKVPGIVDDVFASGYAFRLAFCLYEDNGTFVRTVGESTGIIFGEEDIVGFRDMDWVFSRQPDNYGTIRFRMMHPYTNRLSELKWIEF